jgi:hypothetical protein
MRSCRSAGVAGVQESGVRSAGVQELQELREAKIPLHRWMGNPGTA